MLKQKYTITQQNPPFQLLPSQSPQTKPHSEQQQIQHIQLENQFQNKSRPSRKSRRVKARQKQTTLIKIKPIQSNGLDQEFSINQLSQTPVLQNQCQNKTKAQKQTKSKQRKEESHQAMQSPVLYKISDQEEIEQKQQTIPQSSRRPLKESQNTDKNQGLDSEDSPVKLIRSPRKNRSTQKILNPNPKSFIKTREQVEILEKKQITQVYEYNDNDKHQSNSKYEKEFLDVQYEQSSQNEELDQKEEQMQQEKNEIKKNSITVFKSNSFYTLINAEIPKGNFVNCIIRRKRGKDYFQKMLIYELYLLEDKKYLMTCIKDRYFRATSHFQFYRQKPNTIKYHNQNLYAYLDSNFTGTQFVLKTIQKNDTNSQKSTAIDKSQIKVEESTSVISDQAQKRTSFFTNETENNKNLQNFNKLEERQAAFFSFKANFFGLAGQREVSLLKKKNKKLKQSGHFSDLKTAQQNGQVDKFVQINSKKAMIGKNGLQLDFKGVTKMQSTKNIILQAQNGKEALIFGKVKQDIYAVAIGTPLTIIQGLAFGIANLDRKFFVN